MKVVACCCKGVVANVFIIEEEEYVDDVDTHIAIHFHFHFRIQKENTKIRRIVRFYCFICRCIGLCHPPIGRTPFFNAVDGLCLHGSLLSR